MNKQELKARLIIAQGELNDEVYNENGCFDEIAEKVLRLALESGLMQDTSSEDTLIQLEYSVRVLWDEDLGDWVDAVCLTDAGCVDLYGSNDDGSELYVYSVEELPRETIQVVINELIRML